MYKVKKLYSIVNNAFVMSNNTVIVKAVFEVTSTTPSVTGTTTSGGSSSGGSTTKADVAPVLAKGRAFTKTDATKLSIKACNYTRVDKRFAKVVPSIIISQRETYFEREVESR